MDLLKSPEISRISKHEDLHSAVTLVFSNSRSGAGGNTIIGEAISRSLCCASELARVRTAEKASQGKRLEGPSGYSLFGVRRLGNPPAFPKWAALGQSQVTAGPCSLPVLHLSPPCFSVHPGPRLGCSLFLRQLLNHRASVPASTTVVSNVPPSSPRSLSAFRTVDNTSSIDTYSPTASGDNLSFHFQLSLAAFQL